MPVVSTPSRLTAVTRRNRTRAADKSGDIRHCSHGQSAWNCFSDLLQLGVIN